VLYGYPSAIGNLAAYIQHNQLNAHQPTLIATHAEILYPKIIEDIKRAFPDAPVVNQYWATEANMGVTCPHGNLHVDEDTVIFEVDQPDHDGFGDVLITNLYSYDMPLIRYKIGDRVKLSEKPCPCGRATKVIEEIQGRTSDFLNLKDGRKISFVGLYSVVRPYLNNIISHELIYDKSKNKFILNYVKADEEKSTNLEKLTGIFKNKLGTPLTFNKVNSIEIESSGKQKFVKVLND
jgi:phenylacetate-CoA ligase